MQPPVNGHRSERRRNQRSPNALDIRRVERRPQSSEANYVGSGKQAGIQVAVTEPHGRFARCVEERHVTLVH